MLSIRILTMFIAWILISTPVISAQDLSKYREFQLGMSLAAVAQQAGVIPDNRVLHQRPELIQELMWQPARSLGGSPPADSVRQVLLSFYNGQLFRIVVSYDWERTDGLTVDDMVEALSVSYGRATPPGGEIIPSLSRVSASSDKVVAHWEDAQHSLNLFRPSYASTFGLVLLSKSLDALAQTAIIEAMRLDDRDAPRRGIERRQKQEDEDHARQAKVRLVNKATFKP